MTKVLYFLFGFVISYSFINSHQNSYDIWWHLKVGQDITTEGIRYVAEDPYSYTSMSVKWCVHSWLADIIFYYIYTFVNEEALFLLATLLHISFSLFAFFMVYKKESDFVPSLLVMVISAYLVHNREIRPFVFSEFFLIASFCMVYSIKSHSFFSFNNFNLFFLFLIWNNIHGIAFSIALLYIFSILVGFLLEHRFNARKCLNNVSFNESKILFIFLSVLIHPFIFQLIPRNYTANQYPTIDFLSIFQSTMINGKYTTLIIYILSVCLFIYSILGIFIYEKKQCNWSELLFCICCFWFSFLYQRFFYFLIIPLIYALNLMKIKNNGLFVKINNSLHASVFFIMVFAFLLKFDCSYHKEYSPEMPEGAMAFWKIYNLHGNVFLPPVWSGYIVWKSEGNAKIFTDTRIEPFLNNGMLYLHFLYYTQMNNYLSDIIRFKTRYILVPRDHPDLAKINKKKNITILFQNENETLIEINNSS